MAPATLTALSVEGTMSWCSMMECWCWALVSCVLEHWLVSALVTAIAVAVAFGLWHKSTAGVCSSTRRLNGVTALVTDADTGIGLETAKDLARRGARVLMACQNPLRGQKAFETVRAAAKRSRATVKMLALDLASLDAVRACAAEVRASEPRLHILVNNVARDVVACGYDRTVDGLHKGLQLNHFGPFLLTLLLVDLLRKSAPSRIVFVSSAAHVFAELTPQLLEYSAIKNFNAMKIYSMSKLANIIVSNELARRLWGTGVTVNSVYPGLVVSEIHYLPGWFRSLSNALLYSFFKNAKEGAQTTIHVAVSEELEGVTGCYFVDCKVAFPSEAASDKTLALAVWKKSEKLVQLTARERPFFG